MNNGNSVYLDTKSFEGISSNLNSLKQQINGVWSGDAATTFDSAYSEIISSIDQLTTQINIFNSALAKLETYKSNKVAIANLEQLISNELANPSLPSTESYVENGVTKSRTIYVVNQSLISAWQTQISLLTEENNALRNEINALLSNIVPINSSVDAVNYTVNDLAYTNAGLTNGDYLVSANLQPKNNSDISHRGYTPGNIYDNSAEGFKLAGEKGFWGCEADVRFDSNGNLVCSHNTVKNGQNPTSFEEYLDICKEYGMTAIIDLKYAKGVGPADPDLSPAIIQTIEEKGMIDSCILQTNNYTDIPYIRETSEDARIWYLTDVVSDKNLQLIEENNVECVNIQTSENNAYRINKLTESGVDVCVWNVQTESSKERILNQGAKYVMSDNVLGITPYQEGEEDFNGIAV